MAKMAGKTTTQSNDVDQKSASNEQIFEDGPQVLELKEDTNEESTKEKYEALIKAEKQFVEGLESALVQDPSSVKKPVEIKMPPHHNFNKNKERFAKRYDNKQVFQKKDEQQHQDKEKEDEEELDKKKKKKDKKKKDKDKKKKKKSFSFFDSLSEVDPDIIDDSEIETDDDAEIVIDDYEEEDDDDESFSSAVNKYWRK